MAAQEMDTAEPSRSAQAVAVSPQPARPLNVPGLVCLVLLGVHAVVILLTPFLFRVLAAGDRFAVVSAAVTAVSLSLALALVVVGAVGARTSAPPRLRWAAIGGLVSGAFTLVVQLASVVLDSLMYGTLIL